MPSTRLRCTSSVSRFAMPAQPSALGCSTAVTRQSRAPPLLLSSCSYTLKAWSIQVCGAARKMTWFMTGLGTKPARAPSRVRSALRTRAASSAGSVPPVMALRMAVAFSMAACRDFSATRAFMTRSRACSRLGVVDGSEASTRTTR